MTLFFEMYPRFLFTLCSFCLNDRAYSSLSTMCSLIRLVWTPWILTMSSYLSLVHSPSSPFSLSAACSFYSSYYLLSSISLFSSPSLPPFLSSCLPLFLYSFQRKKKTLSLTLHHTVSHLRNRQTASLLPYLLTYLPVSVHSQIFRDNIVVKIVKIVIYRFLDYVKEHNVTSFELWLNDYGLIYLIDCY